MGDPKVNIIVTAEDKASGTFSGIGSGLAKIGGTLVIGGIAAAAAGIAGLAVGLASCVKGASEAANIQAQLGAVLTSTGGISGMTADSINALATELSKVTRYEDDTIVSGENMLLTFTNIGKDTFPAATQAMLDMSTAMGTDLQGTAIQLGKALNDPIKGISALSRVGVTFSEDQKAVIASLMETGDVAGAQAVILAELAKEFGGSAVAAGQTFAGQLDILKNSFGNVKDAIGTAVLPALTTLVGAIAAWVNDPSTQAFIANLVAWLSVNLPIAIQVLSDFWTGTLLPAITTVWNWMNGTLIPFLQNTVFPWLQTNIPIALQFLSDVWTTVLKPAIETVWNWMSTVLIPFLQDTVKPWLDEKIPQALQVLSDFWTGTLQPAINQVWNWMSTVLMPFLQNTVVPWLEVTIPAAIQTLSDFWTNTLLPAITGVHTFLDKYVNPILIVLRDIFEKLGSITITALAGFWTNILLPALTGVYNFLNDYLTPAFSWLKDNVIGPLATAISNLTTGALQWLLNKLSDLRDWLATIKLPDWLVGNSPSPFEMSLRGIADAMREVTGAAIATNFVPGQLATASAGNTNNFNMTVHTNAGISTLVSDYNMLKAKVR